MQSEFSRMDDGSDKVNSAFYNRLNGWPIDPTHIDYTESNVGGNIISNREKYPSITSELLRRINLEEGKSDFTTGYHVIEFLLWGEDLDKSSSGKRSFKDYDGNNSVLAKRRADYLVNCCDLLIEDLEKLVSEWDRDGKNNIRSRLDLMPDDQAITKILSRVSFLQFYRQILLMPYLHHEFHLYLFLIQHKLLVYLFQLLLSKIFYFYLLVPKS